MYGYPQIRRVRNTYRMLDACLHRTIIRISGSCNCLDLLHLFFGESHCLGNLFDGMSFIQKNADVSLLNTKKEPSMMNCARDCEVLYLTIAP